MKIKQKIDVTKIWHVHWVEICQIRNNLNPEFLKKDLFRLRALKRVQGEEFKFNLELPMSNHVTHDTESPSSESPKVWNALLYHIEVVEDLKIFKRVAMFWDGKTCSGKFCSIYEGSNS